MQGLYIWIAALLLDGKESSVPAVISSILIDFTSGFSISFVHFLEVFKTLSMSLSSSSLCMTVCSLAGSYLGLAPWTPNI